MNCYAQVQNIVSDRCVDKSWFNNLYPKIEKGFRERAKEAIWNRDWTVAEEEEAWEQENLYEFEIGETRYNCSNRVDGYLGNTRSPVVGLRYRRTRWIKPVEQVFTAVGTERTSLIAIFTSGVRAITIESKET